jgi:hypothetical protein
MGYISQGGGPLFPPPPPRPAGGQDGRCHVAMGTAAASSAAASTTCSPSMLSRLISPSNRDASSTAVPATAPAPAPRCVDCFATALLSTRTRHQQGCAFLDFWYKAIPSVTCSTPVLTTGRRVNGCSPEVLTHTRAQYRSPVAAHTHVRVPFRRRPHSRSPAAVLSKYLPSHLVAAPVESRQRYIGAAVDGRIVRVCECRCR